MSAKIEFVGIKILICIFILSEGFLQAGSLRRPLSPTTPMFLFQVQQPDASDPQACINAVPSDVRPYTVMMYCMGAQTGTQTNGYAFADFFCNVAQQNGMWCVFQCASGYANTLNNLSTADYERLLQKYPNLIGFSFAEQNWGFVATSSEWGPSSFPDRLALLADLLPVCSQYGAYLYVSEMQSISNQGYDPIAKFKASQPFANNTKIYKSNYIVGSKFTSGQGYYDNESVALGVYLSGHAGNYAVRFDETAWEPSGRTQLYGLKNPGMTNLNLGYLPAFTTPETAHGIPIVDHMMLQGATVLDGPEFPFISTVLNGRLTPCYKNTTCDVFRKVLDSTIKIPTLTDVLANTPIAYVCNQNNNLTGGLYNGLYQIDGDGTNNHDWFKKSGRYSTVPGIYTNDTYELSGFTTNVLQSQYGTRWPTLAAKTNEFNSYFPSEYTGDAFVTRRENRWFTYNNMLNSNVTKSASIPLQYNTCTNLALTFPPQTFAVITESNKSLQIYFNNYFTDKDSLYATTNTDIYSYMQNAFISNPTDSTTNTTRTTIFQISGCTNIPTYTLTNRGSHQPITNSSTFASGVFTLTLTGNGPCDVTINCSGNATRTGTIPAPNVMVPPPEYVPSTPAPPSSLAATPGYAQATLVWNATNCLYYNVKRGLSVSGPFAIIATGITNSVNLYTSFNSGATVYNTTYSYVDTGLTASNTYYYVVSGVNVSGEGSNSAPAVITIVPTFTNTPVADAYVDNNSVTSNFGSLTNLWVKNSSGAPVRNGYLMFNVSALTNVRSATVTLTANRVDGAGTMYYELAPTNWTEAGITWNNQPGGTGVFLKTNTVSATGVAAVIDVTSAAASQATNGGLLSIRVTQQANSGNALIQFCSRESTIASLRPLFAYTPAFGSSPVGLIANAVSSSQINLTWVASSGASYYNIRRSLTSGGPYTLIAQGIMATNYSDTSPLSGTTYYYVVSAVYSGGESADSAPANATTSLIPAPATLAATLNGNQITLAWSAASGADSYNVKRSYNSGGPYTTVATGVIGTNYSDSVFYTGMTYYYVVAGTDGAVDGTNSPEASLTTTTNMTMEPVADSYVEDGGSTNSNFGTSANLKVKNQGANTTFTRISYLKFDVRALTNAQSAKLKLTPYQVDGSGVTNAFELVTNDAWTETGITWNNQPAASGVIFTNVSGSSYAVGAPVVMDVTSLAVGQATNDGYFSFRIKDPNTNSILIGLCSKEYPTASYHPALQFANPGNTPPVLAAVTNRTIGVGVTLNITNSATDSDVPAQTLVFSLLSAPTNAVLNTNSGVLTWRPLVTQADSTNTITVKVADNGTPSQSATQSFVVTVSPLVSPQISAVSLNAGQLVLQVNGSSGPDYQIQASTNLVNWGLVFTTNSPAMPFVWTNSATGLPMNFFRILVGPPF
jgi:fibronectin type 3 domain-containing protein